METIKRLDASMNRAQALAHRLADARAVAIAREVERGNRGTTSAIARELNLAQPAISQAARRGRKLIAEGRG